MNKIILSLIVASTTMFAETTLSTDKLLEIKNNSKILKDPILKIKKGKDIGSSYFLRLEAKGRDGKTQRIEAFVDKETNDVFLGAGFNKDGKKYAFDIDKNIVDNGIAFNYGNGEKNLYIITDPECPYCIKFGKESKGKLKDYNIHVILMPLPFHKNAKQMISYIINAKDNASKTERYKKILAGDTSYKNSKIDDKKLSEYMKKVMPAIEELQVKGTPSFFIDDKDTLKSIGWVELLDKK